MLCNHVPGTGYLTNFCKGPKTILYPSIFRFYCKIQNQIISERLFNVCKNLCTYSYYCYFCKRYDKYFLISLLSGTLLCSITQPFILSCDSTRESLVLVRTTQKHLYKMKPHLNLVEIIILVRIDSLLSSTAKRILERLEIQTSSSFVKI